MTVAVCFRCGSFKNGGLSLCPACNQQPRTEADAALSLALSDDLAPKTALAKFAHDIRRNQKPSVPPDILQQAQSALTDPQLRVLAGLSSRLDPSNPPKAPPGTTSQRPPIQPAVAAEPIIVQPTVRVDTTLHKNAFALLGVSIRDNRRRIVEAAEERSLFLDHDLCQKARSDLTSPRTRLGAELAWLPGVSPSKAAKILSALPVDPFSVRTEKIPDLALLNVLAAGFELTDGEEDVEPPRHYVDNSTLAALIQSFATIAGKLSPDEVVRHLNEDRAVSGFPEIRNLDQLEAEFAERRRYFRDAIKGALNRRDAEDLIEVMTKVVDGATLSGEEHAPELIDELVDSYAVETQSVLDAEAENVKKLLESTRKAIPSGQPVVDPLIARLSEVVRNWDAIAQPIQLSAKARGIDHDSSRALAYQIRSLAIDLFNNHDMLEQSQRLTSLLNELFSEVPDVSERVQEDSETLSEISQRRSESGALDTVRRLCESVHESIQNRPAGADAEGLRLLEQGDRQVRELRSKVSDPTHNEARDMIALTLMRCAIAYGNETSKWRPCVLLLEKAVGMAADKDLRAKIDENLQIVRSNDARLGDLEPVSEAPSLSTINGFGFSLYGSTDQNPADGSHMATYYFVALFVPLFPIARYRVIPVGGAYRFIGKGPLRSFDKWHLAISVLGLISLFFL